MILVIDNYDSFTYNLVHYLGEFTPSVHVVRNDQMNVSEIMALAPQGIVISPGPCTPDEAGVSVELVRHLPINLPLLGVCLGHQSIAQAFGTPVIRAPYLMHGKISSISHSATGIYHQIPQDFKATRYHSLVIDAARLVPELIADAWSEDGLIMGFHHRERPIFGVQYHPESIRTDCGKQLIQNFLTIVGNYDSTGHSQTC